MYNIPKRNKNVIFLSSSQAGELISNDSNKPMVIMDYNEGKAGVHQLNEEYTRGWKTVRWPLIVLFNILEVGNLPYLRFDEARQSPTVMQSILKNLILNLSSVYAKRRHR